VNSERGGREAVCSWRDKIRVGFWNLRRGRIEAEAVCEGRFVEEEGSRRERK